MIQKSIEQKNWFFKKINKINESLATLRDRNKNYQNQDHPIEF